VGETNEIMIGPKEETILSLKEAKRRSGKRSVYRLEMNEK